MSTVGVLDAHVHLWDPNVLTYEWLTGTELDRRFDLTELAGVSPADCGYIVVQADCAAAQAGREVHWIAALEDPESRIQGIVVFSPVELGDAIEPLIGELAAMPNVVGVRRLLQDEATGFAVQPQFLRGLSIVGDAGYPFDVCVREHQLGDVVSAAQQIQHLTFVLDHLGKPRVGATDSDWHADISRLAKLPNVVCKLSGLGTELAGQHFTADLVSPYLRHALDEFGPARCLFGSDWPVLTSAVTYLEWLATVLDVLADYGPDATVQVLAGTARATYSLGGAAPVDAS